MVVVVIATVLFLTSIQELPAQIVTTTSGPVKGRTVRLNINQSIVQYLGIRYCKAERFEPCEESHWGSVYDAVKPGKPCPQPASFYGVQNIQDSSEDCLHLNIFLPNTSARNLPVMAIIQDVFYSFGSAQSLVEWSKVASMGGIIVVSYNYRLGVAGFLNAENINTNLGLRDNIAALKWLRRNVARFGGNHDDVTLVGHSSAAMAVGLMTISPQAKGLFKRAIMMSGSPLSPLATVTQSTASLNSRRIGEILKCVNMSILAKCLATKPVSDVIKAQQKFKITATQVPFGPMVDGDVIPDAPEKLFKSNSFSVDSIMMGVSEDDGKELLHSGLLGNKAVTESSFSNIIRANTWNGNSTLNKELVKYMYTDWKDSKSAKARNYHVNKFYSDCSFNGPAIRLADISSKTNVPTFFYYITKQAFNTTVSRYTHGDDIRMMFGQLSSNKSMRNVTDLAFVMLMNFVKSGNPSHPKEVDPIWPTYTPNGDYVTIGNDIKRQSDLLPDRMAFWNMLLPSLSAHQLANTLPPTTTTPPISHSNGTRCPEKKDTTKALTAVVAVMAIIIIVMLSVIIYQTRILGKRPESAAQTAA